MRYQAFKFSFNASTPVSVSHDLKHWITKNYQKSCQSLNVIQNGIDNTELQKLDRKECRKKILQQLHIPENKVIATTVARLFPVKGVEHLVKTAAIILEQHKDIHFIVAGDGPEKLKLVTMISEAQIGDRFHLLGECNFVPTLLAASDLYVLPSNSEELSISIIEAMFSRLPIIATEVGDNSYLVHHELNGFLVPKGRPDLLAEKISYMLLNRELWNDMGRLSLEIAQSQFSNSTMLNKYRELYKNV
jgi:glycosyltransferase involved in cell wall biosynthesis